jgi:hypothetical protein
VLALTPEEQTELDALYAKLKPEATQEARDYVLARTPPAWQVDMTAKIEADWPLPPVQTLGAQRQREGAQQRRDVNPNVDPNLPPYAAGQALGQPTPAYDPRVPR